MAYEELAQYASDIQRKAIEKEALELAKNQPVNRGTGSPVPVRIDWAALEQKYAYIGPLFDPFTRLPDPARFDPLIESLNGAMAGLSNGHTTDDPVNEDQFAANPKLDRITTVAGYLQGWSGSAARNFKADFLDPFKSISGNQFILLSTMKGALAAHQEMWRRARVDIEKIALGARDALDNAGGTGKNEWSFAFSVLGAVAAIGALTVVTGGAGAVALAAIGAASAAGGAGVAGYEVIKGSGDTAEAITNSMRLAVNELAKHMNSVEKDIATAVDNLASSVSGSPAVFLAPRPAIAGLSDAELTGAGGLGSSD